MKKIAAVLAFALFAVSCGGVWAAEPMEGFGENMLPEEAGPGPTDPDLATEISQTARVNQFLFAIDYIDSEITPGHFVQLDIQDPALRRLGVELYKKLFQEGKNELDLIGDAKSYRKLPGVISGVISQERQRNLEMIRTQIEPLLEMERAEAAGKSVQLSREDRDRRIEGLKRWARLGGADTRGAMESLQRKIDHYRKAAEAAKTAAQDAVLLEGKTPSNAKPAAAEKSSGLMLPADIAAAPPALRPETLPAQDAAHPLAKRLEMKLQLTSAVNRLDVAYAEKIARLEAATHDLNHYGLPADKMSSPWMPPIAVVSDLTRAIRSFSVEIKETLNLLAAPLVQTGRGKTTTLNRMDWRGAATPVQSVSESFAPHLGKIQDFSESDLWNAVGRLAILENSLREKLSESDRVLRELYEKTYMTGTYHPVRRVPTQKRVRPWYFLGLIARSIPAEHFVSEEARISQISDSVLALVKAAYEHPLPDPILLKPQAKSGADHKA